MARRMLRDIAKKDGSDEKRANSFAECCIHILQTGCRYNKQVESHITRLLCDREEKVCCDVLNVLKKPHRQIFRPRNMGPAPPPTSIPYFHATERSQHGKRRFQSPDSRSRDHNRNLYYTDRNPHEHNQYRPGNQQHNQCRPGGRNRHKRRRRQHHQSQSRQVGRVEPERGGTHARPQPLPGQSQRTSDGP